MMPVRRLTPVSARGFSRSVRSRRILAASAHETEGRYVAIELVLDRGGLVRIEASAGARVELEQVDERTFTRGGLLPGDMFARLVMGVEVQNVLVLGIASGRRAWSAVLNPGPPRSLVIRERPYPAVTGGLRFSALHPDPDLAGDDDAYSVLTGELAGLPIPAQERIAP